jgi:uncharacterized protein (DUF433 family)
MRSKEVRNASVPLPAPSPTPSPASWIEISPDVCGGDARIRKTRITVWGLVEWRNLGLADAEIIARVSGLTQADLDAAWEYYERHREEIDQAIRANVDACFCHTLFHFRSCLSVAALDNRPDRGSPRRTTPSRSRPLLPRSPTTA